MNWIQQKSARQGALLRKGAETVRRMLVEYGGINFISC